MTILEILEAHKVLAFSGSDTVCACDRTWRPDAEYRAHLVEVLDKHMQERMAHERAHTIQMIRDQSDWTQDETDEYGRVTLEGYLTIGTRELDKIEDGTGADRMCFSLADWEKREEQVRAEAKAEALNEYAETLGYRISGAIRKYGQAQGDFRDIIQELRARADQYKEEPNNGR